MDRSEFIYCFEALRKGPPIFFSTRDYRNKIECLNKLRAEATPSNVAELFSLLKVNDKTLRMRVAEIILFLSGRLKSQNQLYDNLKYVRVQNSDIDFYKENYSEETLAEILGIVSLNSSGYIRERALLELGLLKRPEAIRYVLLRLGDWVMQVREAAEKTLKTILIDANREALINELTVIDSLKKVTRTDLSHVQEDILQFVCSIDLTEQFYSRLKVSNKSKLLFIKNYVRINGFRESYFKLLSTDSNFLIRKESVQFIGDLKEEDQKEMLTKLAKDRSVHVRLAILYSLKKVDSSLEQIVFNQLFDSSTSIRDLSRFLLKGRYDFPKIYRERALNAGNTGSILGLGETGSKEDIELLEQLIMRDSIRIKLACIQALKNLDISVAKKYCLDLFIHDSGKIRKRCIDVLAQTWNSETQEKIEQAYESTDTSRKKTILDLYNRVGGWVAVGPLIRAVSENDAMLRNTAWPYLKRWRDKITNVFVTPPEDQVRKAIALHELTDTTKFQMTQSQATLWKEVRYCLR